MKLMKVLPLLIFTNLMHLCAQESSTNSPSSPFNQSKFVPDISMIIDFSYVFRDLNNDRFSALILPGLNAPLGSEYNSEASNTKRGFNFNYGEMSLYSIVDPYFDLFGVIHLTPEHAGLEEAYITTRKLPYGFQIKAGKFLSGIGRSNDQHGHSWDFANRPLITQAIFGEEGLNEIGVQITWVAPTDIYLKLGVEILNGENETSFGTTGFSDPDGIVHVGNSEGPNLFVSYAKSSFDLGDASFLYGFSYANGTTRMEQDFSASNIEGSAIKANTDIFCGDLTIKYMLDPIRYISFQSEYLYRRMDGSYFTRETSIVSTNSLTKKQSGFYSQIVAKSGLQWRIGIRYDLLNLNDVFISNVNQNFPHNPAKYSAMIDYNPTEFSRLRLQVDHDRSQSLDGLSLTPYTQVILQLNVAIGAHGAHSF